MNKPVKVLIVEDEALIAARISVELDELGYEVSGMVTRADQALLHCQQIPPDVILLDIKLKGKIDGIQLAHELNERVNIPIIFLTANADEATFNRAKETLPQAFISKPYKKLDLEEQTIKPYDMSKKPLYDGKKRKTIPHKCALEHDKRFIKKVAEGKRAMKKLFFVAVICFLFMGLEFAGGILSGSLAVLTDAAHMFSDVAGFMISFFSIYISQNKATFNYSMGYHRAEILVTTGSVG